MRWLRINANMEKIWYLLWFQRVDARSLIDGLQVFHVIELTPVRDKTFSGQR